MYNGPCQIQIKPFSKRLYNTLLHCILWWPSRIFTIHPNPRVVPAFNRRGYLPHIGKHIKFNAFLLRLYFDGNDEIAWHTDGRIFLGDEPTIASLSLGCRATFQMRRMQDVWPCVNGTGGGSSAGGTTAAAAAATPIQSFTL
ncbi:hypothetical protein ACHAWC_002928 [Mediolabrus comicus]